MTKLLILLYYYSILIHINIQMENFSESYSSSAFEDTPEYKEAILNFKESTYSIEKEIKKNRPPTDKF
ncbi:hypothetical protein IJL65_01490 [bacterium]|nr:hypothetical protein [bacterium]